MSTWNPSFSGSSSCELQEGNESRTGLEVPSRKLKVTLLSSEWKSTKGGLSTINRELAIELAKHQNVEVSMYLPCCSEEDVRVAEGYHIKLIKAKELIGVEPNEWLFSAPENHEIDYVIGHGLILGRQVQLIQKQLKCKWVQVVHTDPEDLGRFKAYKNAISRAEEKRKAEIELCKLADEVVAVGPKLADQYSRHLRHCQRDQSVFEVTPSIFSEFSVVKQAAEERRTFCVLVFGRGDTEDFELKGYDIAAKAISELNEESYELTFVGAPPGKEEEIAAKLCQHGIAQRQLTVRSFKESREYLGRLFCEVDLCIMPSRTEGFGLAALEALSAGLPILVSGNSGLGDALQDVPLGSSCVVNSEDPKEWAKAIKSVRKKRRNVRLEETEILRTQYAKKYCWKEQCDELVKMMFNNIFDKKGKRPLHPRRVIPPSRKRRHDTDTWKDKKGKRPLHPSVTPSKKRRHDTDTWREIHPATEAPSVTRSHLATTADAQARTAVYTGVPERQAAEKLEKTPFHQNAASPRKKQTHDTDIREDKKGKRPLHPRLVIPPSRKQRHDTNSRKDKKGKRPLHPSVTPSKKQRHDTDTWREIHPATEAPSVTRSHLATTADAQARTAVYTGVPERQAAEKLEKTPFHQNAASPRKKQTHDTDIREGAIADSVVVKLLRHVYKKRAEFSPLPWSQTMKLHLDEVYTRLKIVSRPKKRVHSEGPEIDLGNIFGSTGEDSMALAEGSPGIGKTTLCLKLAYDWASESMPSTFPVFELVLLLKCRDLDGDIMEAIFEQLLPEDMEEKAKKRLRNFITDIHSQERILIILDGLDELPERSKHHVDKLLDRRILPFCYVLATARQEKGIEARKQFAFDICLQIEGFTEEDSFKYIRKHFQNIDPSKGERLIKETKENTFLHPLRNNPLNLLLLCVVYEDHEGELPSSRTNLYQIIVRCLLKRYCEKNACKYDKDLEKQFEPNILVLGELAWECLLNDRHSFREDELTMLERSDDKLVVRFLGLVYKEESLKILEPNHEYFFLHKSFQEYMAAFYIAHKLRRNQFKVFKRLSFHQLVIEFPEVFLFVCGILLEDASTLFTQIGEELKSYWDWLQCNAEETRFFLESFSESRNPEQMAYTLFSFLPFPRVLQLFVNPDEVGNYVGGDLVRLLSTCTGIPEVPKPAEVHLKTMTSWDFTVFRELASIPNVTSLYFLADKYIFGEPEFFKEISNFTSLSELTLPSAVEWEIVAEYLRTNKTLEKLTFALFDESDDGWAKALDAGLCADTPLSSVGLRIHGSLSPAALQALENLLFNKFLSSLSLYIYGDMQDSLAVVLARGFTGEIAVKEVDLCVSGKLSLHGAMLIERGIVGNNSRTKLIVSLRGEVPDNWQAVGNNLHSRFGQKTPALITIHPNTFSKVTASQVAHFRPFGIEGGSRVRQNVTLIVWGELGGDGAEALHENLLCSPLSHLTLDIHGKLTNDIVNFTARWADERNTLSSLTINTWEELTKEGRTLFKELKLDKNPTVTLNVCEVPAPPEESRDNEFVSIDNLDSLIALFKEAKNTRKHNLSARISIESDDEAEECNVLPGKEILKNSDLGNGVHAGVASNSNFSREPDVHAPPEESRDDEFVSIHDLKSLIALFKEAKNTGKQILSARISIKGDDDDDDDDDGDDDDDAEGCNGNLLDFLTRKETLKNSDLGNGVDVGAASNTSFIAPTPLNINYTNFSREPEDGLDHVLASNTTLNDLRLTFDDDDDDDMNYSWALPLGDGLARNTSLKNLTLAIHYYKEKSGKWRESLGSGLERNTSLKNLTVVIENNAYEVASELGIDWARSTSVENLFLTVNSDSMVWDSWTRGTGEGLARKKSLKSLTLTINNFGELTLYWGVDKSWENNSLNNFSLTINNYGNIRPLSFFDGFFCQFKSLTTFNLTLNLCGKPDEDILYDLLEEAMKSQSLKTLRLKVNDSQITNGRRRYDFSRYVVTSPSLSLIEVTVSFYGVEKSSRE